MTTLGEATTAMAKQRKYPGIYSYTAAGETLYRAAHRLVELGEELAGALGGPSFRRGQRHKMTGYQPQPTGCA